MYAPRGSLYAFSTLSCTHPGLNCASSPAFRSVPRLVHGASARPIHKRLAHGPHHRSLQSPDRRRQIAAISAGTNVRYEATTNGSGEYHLANLPPGSYRIEIEKPGFKKLIKPDVILHVQDALEIDFEMTLGAASETITVEAGAPLVNTESGTVSTVIDRAFVENLPLNGRSFQTLIMLTPGVVVTATAFDDQGQFSVNGQRADANYFTVDGVSANFGVTGYIATGADRRRSAARAQRFGWDQQPGVGGCHAGVSHPDVFVCSGVRTHARRTDLDCDALRNQ